MGVWLVQVGRRRGSTPSPSKNYHLIVVEGFVYTCDTESCVVWEFSPGRIVIWSQERGLSKSCPQIPPESAKKELQQNRESRALPERASARPWSMGPGQSKELMELGPCGPTTCINGSCVRHAVVHTWPLASVLFVDLSCNVVFCFI